jgi:hypothetical protein
MSDYIPHSGDRNTVRKFTWGQLWRIKKLADKAWAATRALYPNASMEDDHADAFRHAYWSALMTAHLGPSIAKYVGDQHENVEDNPADRKEMDLFNNHLGRQIALANMRGSDEDLQTACRNAVAQGRAKVIRPSS